MTSYVATFFTHFDAIKFMRELHRESLNAQLSPVPRRLSSSCGTCVRFAFDGDPLSLVHEELEQLVRVEGENYIVVHDNR